MPDANVIQPNGSLKSAVEQNGLAADPDSDTIRILGFPKFLSEYDITIKRKVIDNRETTMSITVDLLTGTCRKNDVYPEIQTWTLSSSSLLNPRLGRETAIETAHSFVRRRINRKYKSFTVPEIRSSREDTVFKLFWIVPTSSPDTVHVVDTISHQLTAENVELDEFAEQSSTNPLDG